MPAGLSSTSVTLINYAGGAFAAAVVFMRISFLLAQKIPGPAFSINRVVGLIILGLCGERNREFAG